MVSYRVSVISAVSRTFIDIDVYVLLSWMSNGVFIVNILEKYFFICEISEVSFNEMLCMSLSM